MHRPKIEIKTSPPNCGSGVKPPILHIDGREVARLAWSAQNIPFDPAKKPDYTAILFVDTEAEAITTLIDYMRAKGYIVETKENTIIIHSKAAGG